MQLSSAPGIGPAYTRRWRPFHADSLHGRAAAHRRLKDGKPTSVSAFAPLLLPSSALDTLSN